MRAMSVVLFALSACAARATVSPQPLTSDGADKPPPTRQPPGVFLDVAPAYPEAHDRAEAGGSVALTPGLSTDDAVALARAFFRALLASDAAALHELSSSQIDAASLTSLERRTDGIALLHLSVDTVAALDATRIATFDVAPRALRDETTMQLGDALVVVPIKLERPGGVRVFGPRVVLLLRRDGAQGAYRIVKVLADETP